MTEVVLSTLRQWLEDRPVLKQHDSLLFVATRIVDEIGELCVETGEEVPRELADIIIFSMHVQLADASLQPLFSQLPLVSFDLYKTALCRHQSVLERAVQENNEKRIRDEIHRIYHLAGMALLAMVDNAEEEILEKIRFNTFRYPAEELQVGDFDHVMSGLKKRSKERNLKEQFYGPQQ